MPKNYTKHLRKHLLPHYLYLLSTIASTAMPITTHGWGFLAHRTINEKAIFILPPQLLFFYKKHLVFIKEEATKADKRRYVVKQEAPRHFINIECYEENPNAIPHHWYQAKKHYGSEFMAQYGILPWHIVYMKKALTKAFQKKDITRILRLSADIGHYIADAHVPLHTTANYNGQKTKQHGIHFLWESRIPELFIAQYNFLFNEKATYITNVEMAIWQVVKHAHKDAKKVLAIEKELDNVFIGHHKYSYEIRGSTIVRTYSHAYASAYHQALKGMVEKRMRMSIKMVASLWLTCWIDAGSPDLSGVKEVIYNDDQAIEDHLENFLSETPVSYECNGEHG